MGIILQTYFLTFKALFSIFASSNPADPIHVGYFKPNLTENEHEKNALMKVFVSGPDLIWPPNDYDITLFNHFRIPEGLKVILWKQPSNMKHSETNRQPIVRMFLWVLQVHLLISNSDHFIFSSKKRVLIFSSCFWHLREKLTLRGSSTLSLYLSCEANHASILILQGSSHVYLI